MIIIAIVLLLAVLFKEDIISISMVERKKDLIDSVSKLVTIVAIIVGGILSYLKFFKGRVLKPKLNIVPSVGFIELENENLHWIDLEIENKGSVAIWNYQLKVTATLHSCEPKKIQIKNFISPALSSPIQENLIDVGESAFEHATFNVQKDIYAITFHISVTDQSDSIWDRYITSANSTKIQKNKPDESHKS